MADNISDFQQICNEWGNWFSRQHGTTCRWVRLHAEGRELENYQKYKIGTAYEGTVFGADNPIEAPLYVARQEQQNESDVEQSITVSFEESASETFTFSLTQGITLGDKVAGEIGLPKEIITGKVSEERSIAVNFSSTQAFTKTISRKWSVTQPVKVPPHKKVIANLAITQKKYDVDFTSNIAISGYVAIWNEDQIDLGNGRHWLYFFPVSKVLRDKPHPEYIVRGTEVIFKAKGRFTGINGICSTVSIKQSPLDSNLLRGQDATTNLVPVDPGMETEGLMNPIVGYVPGP